MKSMNLIRKIGILFLVLLGIIFLTGKFSVNAEEEKIQDGNGYVTRYGSSDYVTVKPYNTKDTEFRAVWVSPLVGDINRYSSKAQYQAQILSVLDNMQYFNLNVMLFHVRIMNDSLYPSKYNDWSIYYDTNPDWDALPWIIEECHKRGIEFHAWMNPYRVQNGTYNLATLARNYRSTNMACNADNLLQGKNSVILNPGIPEVRDWLVNVCMEVVENYDVDAIHFDDYFYDAGIDDTRTQNMYRPKDMSVGDWRREQVSLFIQSLSTSIRAYNQEHNRRVELGISPSGVWRADSNRSNGFGTVTFNPSTNMVETEGSRTSTASFQHYDNYLYSDTLYWINREWIDYIVPQTYWALNHPNCPYADLMDWWDEVCSYKNVRCYSGMGLYLHDSSGGYGWYTNNKEAYYQIRYCNGLDNVDGFSFFAYSDILQAARDNTIMPGVKGLFSNIAILPEIKTQSRIIPGKIENLKVYKTNAGYKLSFNASDDAKFYVIYRSDKEITSYNASDVIAIIGDLSVDGVMEYMDANSDINNNYYYAVRSQSYSRTLGLGAKVSTANAENGTLVNLGEIENFSLTKNGNSVDCFFSPFNYVYGDTMTYTIAYKFDDGAEITNSAFQQKNGYYFKSIAVPSGAKTLTATLIINNGIGESTKTINLNLVSNLPDITNFMINDNVLYNNKNVEFIWNNPNIPGAKYVIQESKDSFSWNDLTEINDVSDVFNIHKECVLSDNYGEMYYRVKMILGDDVSYSSVLKTTVYNYLGEIKNIRLDGARLKTINDLTEGDVVELAWGIIDDADYRVLISYNNETWISVLSYSSVASIVKNGNQASTKIGINYKYLHFLLKIEASANGKYSYSNIYEFYVSVDDIYPDDVIGYLNNEYKLFINNMGIYQ